MSSACFCGSRCSSLYGAYGESCTGALGRMTEMWGIFLRRRIGAARLGPRCTAGFALVTGRNAGRETRWSAATAGRFGRRLGFANGVLLARTTRFEGAVLLAFIFVGAAATVLFAAGAAMAGNAAGMTGAATAGAATAGAAIAGLATSSVGAARALP